MVALGRSLKKILPLVITWIFKNYLDFYNINCKIENLQDFSLYYNYTYIIATTS